MKILADIDGDGTAEYEYEVKLAQSVTINAKEDSTTLPLPGTKAEESIVQAFQGESEEINISFIIYNDGTDKSNGTCPQDSDFNDPSNNPFEDTTGNGSQDVVTIQEQIKFLKDYIKTPNISSEHQFEGYPLVSGDFKQGRLVEVNPQIDAGSPNHVPCDLRIVVGQVL